MYERQNCPESDLYGSTQVESPNCRARSQICTKYMLGVRFVRACHLALYGGRATDRHYSDRPLNRPTESDRKQPRHPTKKVLQRDDSVPCLIKKFSMFFTIYFYLTDFFPFFLGFCQRSAPHANLSGLLLL